ncbi:MAG: hypothetical protein ABH833_04445 [Parcubacteria group bacterium]
MYKKYKNVIGILVITIIVVGGLYGFSGISSAAESVRITSCPSIVLEPGESREFTAMGGEAEPGDEIPPQHLWEIYEIGGPDEPLTVSMASPGAVSTYTASFPGEGSYYVVVTDTFLGEKIGNEDSCQVDVEPIIIPPPIIPPPIEGGSDSIFSIPNPLGADDFGEFIELLSSALLKLAIPIAIALILYSGVLFIISQGVPEKITKARNTLTYTLLGLAIVLIGRGFVSLIQSILALSQE